MLSDFTPLEVAIGLSFVYMTLAFLCSGLNEAVSSIFAWRAVMLEEGIRNLLNDPKGDGLTARIYGNPLIRALTRPSTAREVDTQGIRRALPVRRLVAWTRRERYPSYIPSRAFAAALLEGAGHAPDQLEAAIKGLGNPPVEQALLTLLNDARGDAVRFRLGVERWYDDSMERVSGWYRRRVQLFIWVWALATAIILNADTLNMVSKLWSDKTVRDAVVASAQSPSAPTDVGQVAENVGDLSSLDVPLGWDFSDGGSRDLPSGVIGWLAKIIGLLLTGAAISLGAPFWFDLLGKVARLRSAGTRPQRAPPPETVDVLSAVAAAPPASPPPPDTRP